jgi:predicted permease
VDPQAAMKANDRTMAEGHSRFTLGKALVVAQMTLSLVLIVAAGLLLGSFRNLAKVDPGFRSEGILIARMDLRRAGYGDEEMPLVKAAILERLRSTPGIRAASSSQIVPISGAGWNGPIAVAGFEPQHERDNVVFFNAVSGDFFATMGTPLLAGREFTRSDRATTTPVAVINEAMARKFFGARNPIGQRIRLARPGEPVADGEEVDVVGVVRDTKYRSLREETEELVYLPITQAGFGGPSMVVQVRGDGAADALIPLVTAASADLSPRITLRYSVLSEVIDASLGRDRVLATLSSVFGGLALLLAVIGLYGTMAYNVARRRAEIGIRVALGAAGERVLRMVLGDAGRLVAMGLVIGLLLALLGGRLLTSFLYGMSATDPATLALSALLLAVVALCAGAIPAWRAARVDPMAVLREE